MRSMARTSCWCSTRLMRPRCAPGSFVNFGTTGRSRSRKTRWYSGSIRPDEAKHARFRANHAFPFALLADPGQRVGADLSRQGADREANRVPDRQIRQRFATPSAESRLPKKCWRPPNDQLAWEADDLPAGVQRVQSARLRWDRSGSLGPAASAPAPPARGGSRWIKQTGPAGLFLTLV